MSIMSNKCPTCSQSGIERSNPQVPLLRALRPSLSDGRVRSGLETRRQEGQSCRDRRGEKRPLGIPTLKDRVAQMAMVLMLKPIFEADFLDCSHGFRRGRQAYDALDLIRTNCKAGRTAVHDADLKNYFDTIPHDKLMACVRMRVSDSRILVLIRGWLRTPIVEMAEQ